MAFDGFLGHLPAQTSLTGGFGGLVPLQTLPPIDVPDSPLTWVWPDSLIMIGLIVVVALAARWVVSIAVQRVTDVAVNRATRHAHQTGKAKGKVKLPNLGASARGSQRTRTVASLLRNLATIIITTIAILMIMSVLGLPLGPLLASAGVGGVAIAFGAQSLVKDFMSGTFLILEDQYGVGDEVQIGDITGTVEEVTLRVTRIRDFHGQVWYIRHGEIAEVGNHSQGWSRAVVNFLISDTADVDAAIEVLATAAKKMHENDPSMSTTMLEDPQVQGVVASAPGQLTVRLICKTAPGAHWGVEREMLRQGELALKEAGIPVPRVVTGPPEG